VAVRADKWHYTRRLCQREFSAQHQPLREDIIFLTQLGAFSSKTSLFAASALLSDRTAATGHEN
jgi:hypothetical protein